MALASAWSDDPSPVAVLERQRRRESAARTYARSFPIVPVRARGMTIEGADGRHYLDCLSGAGTLALGHNHPVVVEAIRRVLDSGAPLHVLDLGTSEKDEFTSVLLETMPGGPSGWRVHFCGPAGTDAVEAALKLTRTVTGRRNVLTFTGAYHGMTAGALAVSANVEVKAPLGTTGLDVTRLPYPYDYRCPFGIGGDMGTDIGVRYLETLLTDSHSGMLPPAAMIVEPVQGEGGTIPAPDSWLRRMRQLTATHGIPLIIDEVQTGVGRTGAFWAVEHSDVIPDVMVLSKAIGGSLPLAVIVYREELDSWAPGAHTGTFRGNQLAMAAGTATLRYVAEAGLVQRAAEVGDRIMRELRTVQTRQPCIGQVRGRGLMIGVEIVRPDAESDARGARPAAPDIAREIRSQCLRRDLLVELGGRNDAVVRLLPPLTITDDEATTVVERLAEAIVAAERDYAGVPA
ncbi:aminotransferase class III-fold pyridoxal phosphate-dependent enzyme [Micromonospora sp. KC207]|uniref:diaminobutyrate--2-oxoglutarate transaminase family protein n=1 Tax=Micromonospora sp. KC207 TaxID=2530377 RepID=UPI001051AE89|nr:diaminobutyrate--2-oxoglutarate transaminase family protein [Micromonospora sp. KC207]TDC66624.1 aminotransferase class III-fold pyridoxal phosphate-dependent enzyme [Micromonospora sp. KC207]